MRRNLKIYFPVVLCLIALGLPSRISPEHFPRWYVLYAGDFLWAALVFFLYCLIFNLKTKYAAAAAAITACLIEFSQLFHPVWLEQLRSIKVFSLALGFGFLWTDLIAYAFGIVAAASIDLLIVRRTMDNN